jgi:ribosomal protein S18 acetylase RimI-like enzyme
MAAVALRRMTQAEYERWRPASIESYACERARNAGTSVEAEREVAARQFAQFLGEGLETEGALLWHVVLQGRGRMRAGESAESDEGEEVVGTLWVQVSADRGRAFIYEIEIGEAYRRRGYGRRALELLEDEMRPMGVRRIGLNVFADNAGAQALYRLLGYAVTNMNMQKVL